MLKVRTYIDKSTVPDGGMGCFAAEDIPEGTIIWDYNPIMDRTYTDENIKLMTELEQEFIYKFAHKYNGLYYLRIDNARFFSHSPNPNTMDPLDNYTTYAIKDIKKGEEILCDYGCFKVDAVDKLFNVEPMKKETVTASNVMI